MRHDDPDDDKVWFRSKRIFHTDDGWYVATREGDLGPLPDRRLAAIQLKHYVRELERQRLHNPRKPHSEMAVPHESGLPRKRLHVLLCEPFPRRTLGLGIPSLALRPRRPPSTRSLPPVRP